LILPFACFQFPSIRFQSMVDFSSLLMRRKRTAAEVGSCASADFREAPSCGKDGNAQRKPAAGMNNRVLGHSQSGIFVRDATFDPGQFSVLRSFPGYFDIHRVWATVLVKLSLTDAWSTLAAG